MKLEMTVAEVAALVAGVVEGAPERRLTALRSPAAAGPDDLAVLFREGDPGGAGCLVVPEGSAWSSDEQRSLVRVADAEVAMDQLTAQLGPTRREPAPGVHPSAVVADDAQLGEGVALGPHVTVGAGARVGARTRLGAGVVIGADAVVGEDCDLRPRVVIEERCTLGDRVVIHPGTVIGADGFGYRPGPAGVQKSPQVGVVTIGDDVEIGALTTIDRARLEATVIGAGSKIDNQVQIGHNCIIGRSCVIAAQSGFSGGVVFGDGVLAGGHVLAVDGVTVGDGARLGAGAGLEKSVPAGAAMKGIPATPLTEHLRLQVALNRLPKLHARVKALEAARDP